MRRAAALAAAVAVSCSWAVVSIGALGAQEAVAAITDVGWWSSNPAAASPEKGLAVSSGPNGAITVAAIRVSVLADDIDTATLTLTEEGGVQASGAALQLCPTPNAWTAGPKQAMDKAPKPECDRAKVALARGADGTWTADVTTLLAAASDTESEVSVMVVPAGAGAVPVGFEVRFKPPALAATGTFDDDDDDSSSLGSGSSSSSGGLDDSTSSSFGSGGDDRFAGASSSFSPSSSFADTSPLPALSSAQTSGTFESSPTASDTAAGEVTSASAPVGTGVARPAVPVGRSAPRGSRAVQALFFVVVASIIGVGTGIAHARFRPPGGVLA